MSREHPKMVTKRQMRPNAHHLRRVRGTGLGGLVIHRLRKLPVAQDAGPYYRRLRSLFSTPHPRVNEDVSGADVTMKEERFGVGGRVVVRCERTRKRGFIYPIYGCRVPLIASQTTEAS